MDKRYLRYEIFHPRFKLGRVFVWSLFIPLVALGVAMLVGVYAFIGMMAWEFFTQ
jgi:hypothetical protein